MILMIDDEPEYTITYKDELELSGYQVEFVRDVDSALEFFEKHRGQIELVILDIMMSPGRALADVDTQNGLRTGVPLFDRIRELAPGLPILILTNVSDEKVAAHFRRKENCRFRRKEDYLPFELVKEVTEFLNEDKASAPR